MRELDYPNEGWYYILLCITLAYVFVARELGSMRVIHSFSLPPSAQAQPYARPGQTLMRVIRKFACKKEVELIKAKSLTTRLVPQRLELAPQGGLRSSPQGATKNCLGEQDGASFCEKRRLVFTFYHLPCQKKKKKVSIIVVFHSRSYGIDFCG